MKISTKGRYGLRALVDLAANVQDVPVPLAEIAGRQKISLNYLEQVFGTLRKAGIIKSVKGPSGGYMLARPVEDITVEEVLRALEGEFSIVETESKDVQDLVQQTIQKLVWDKINQRVNEVLQRKTLASLVAEYKSLQGAEENMYYI